MIRYNGVYSAVASSIAATGAGPLIELQVPTNVQVDILRIWVGAAEGTDPVAEVQEVYIYGNDAPTTGGSAMTEQIIRGSTDAASGVVAVQGGSQGATPTTLYRDGYHVQNGWLYLPVPDERIRTVGGSSIDNVGLGLPVAPDQSMTISCGIIWGEIG